MAFQKAAWKQTHIHVYTQKIFLGGMDGACFISLHHRHTPRYVGGSEKEARYAKKQKQKNKIRGEDVEKHHMCAYSS